MPPKMPRKKNVRCVVGSNSSRHQNTVSEHGPARTPPDAGSERGDKAGAECCARLHLRPCRGLGQMQQVSDGKVTGVAVFLKAGSTNATIQELWQGMPNTPGKEQEVVGVKLIPAASCTPRSRRCRFFAVREALWPLAHFSSPA